MSKVTIEIPDGKLCYLVKKNTDIFDCPCHREVGAPKSDYCGLYHEFLDGTTNSVPKCKKCREMNE